MGAPVPEEAGRDGLERALLEAALRRCQEMIVFLEAGAGPGGRWARVTYVNETFEHRTGHGRRRMIDGGLERLCGPATDRRELDRLLGELAAGRQVHSLLQCYERSGEPFWLSISGRPVRRSSTGAVACVLSCAPIETTPEEDLDEPWESLIVDELAPAVFAYDRAGRVVYWSRRAEELYGWRRYEVLGQPVASFLAQDEGTTDAALGALRREGAWEGELVHATRSGDALAVHARKTLIRGDGLRPDAALVRVEPSGQRDEGGRDAPAAAGEELAVTVAGLAHDFKNNLTIQSGIASVLVRHLGEDPKLGSLARMAGEAADQALALAERIIALARPAEAEPIAVDVNDRLEGMRERLAFTAGEGCTVALALGARAWPVSVDPTDLERAVVNLVANARDALRTVGGGTVTIATRNVAAADGPRDRRFVELSVADDGPGMSEETRARALDAFFSTKGEGGSGLGLNNVKRFAEEAGGGIAIDSRPGRGTRVTLRLPVALRVAGSGTVDRGGPQ